MPPYTNSDSASSSFGRIEVLYEDNHIISVYKPFGVLTQGDASGDPSLMDWVKDYLRNKYSKPGNIFLGMVHRLDRLVCGVVVFARTSKAAGRLSEQIRNGKVEKTYHAMVEGTPGKLWGTLTHYLGCDASTGVLVSEQPSEGLRKALLHFRVLSHYETRSLLEIRLETGRKHQIRAQLSRIGCPVVGDRKYGAKTICFECKGIGLVCRQMAFSHPTRRDEFVSIAVPEVLYPLGELMK